MDATKVVGIEDSELSIRFVMFSVQAALTGICAVMLWNRSRAIRWTMLFVAIVVHAAAVAPQVILIMLANRLQMETSLGDAAILSGIVYVSTWCAFWVGRSAKRLEAPRESPN